MEKEKALSYVAGVIREHVTLHDEDVEIEMDSQLADIGVESLDILVVVMTIEKEKKITIPDDVVYHLKTVGELVDYVSEYAK